MRKILAIIGLIIFNLALLMVVVGITLMIIQMNVWNLKEAWTLLMLGVIAIIWCLYAILVVGFNEISIEIILWDCNRKKKGD